MVGDEPGHVGTSRGSTVPWAAVIPLVVFGAGLVALVFTTGLCCYDDASFALLSRSVAEGRGYSLPFSYVSADTKWPVFDPTIGNGPVSILPVALAIKVFGAKYWVPGLTHVVLELCLLALAAYLLLRIYSNVRVLFFLTSALLLVNLVSQGWMKAWGAQLGEPVAALLVLCGYLAWTMHARSTASAAATGLLLGFAVLTKELAAIYVVAFLAMAFTERVRRLRTKPLDRNDARIFLAVAVGGIAPFVLFESWRLWTLGLRDFYLNWREHYWFIRNQSVKPEHLAQMFDLVVARSNVAKETFVVSVPAGFALAGAAFYLPRLGASVPVKRFSALLSCGLILHFAHWLLASNGWPRYLYVAVILWCFVLASPILAGISYRLFAAYVAAVLIVVAPGFHNVPLIAGVRDAIYKREVNPNDAALAVLRYLDQQGAAPAYTSWWAHVATPQYFSQQPARFFTRARSNLGRQGEPIFVLLDSRLLAESEVAEDLLLVAELKRCGGPEFTAGPYQLFRCLRS